MFCFGALTWNLHTMSAAVASMSTTLPLPSSPHWEPSTTDTLLSACVRNFLRGEPFCVPAGVVMLTVVDDGVVTDNERDVFVGGGYAGTALANTR